MSCALIGCLIGAVTSGGLSNRFGRKRLLTLAALSFLRFRRWELVWPCISMHSWRGESWAATQSDLPPVSHRCISRRFLRRICAAGLSRSIKLAIVFGILLAQVVNWLIARPVPLGVTAHQILLSWNGQWGWRWMFAVTAIPSVLFLLASLTVPRALVGWPPRGGAKHALNVLERLGGRAYAQQVLEDFAAASEAQPERAGAAGASSPGMGKGSDAGRALAVLQQWCGINVIFNYAQEIFAAAGYQVSDILFNIVVTGAVNVSLRLLRSPPSTDMAGASCYSPASLGWFVIYYSFLDVLYRAAPAAASPCWCWFLLPLPAMPCRWPLRPGLSFRRSFPTASAAAPCPIAVTALWSACFLLTYTFPLLNATLGPAGTFWTYAAVCLAGLLFLLPPAGDQEERPSNRLRPMHDWEVHRRTGMREGQKVQKIGNRKSIAVTALFGLAIVVEYSRACSADDGGSGWDQQGPRV